MFLSLFFFFNCNGCHIELVSKELNHFGVKLGSVAGPVIQANGRLSFEDGLRSGGLLCCVSQ